MTILVQQDSDPELEPARWHLISYHTLEDVQTGKLKVSQMDRKIMHSIHHIFYCRDRPHRRSLRTYTYHPIFFFRRPFVLIPRLRLVPMEIPGLCKCSINTEELVLRTSSEVEDGEYGIPVLSPPPCMADATGESRTPAGLQGTISTLNCNQQKVSLDATICLQNFFASVINISVVIHVSVGSYTISGM